MLLYVPKLEGYNGPRAPIQAFDCQQVDDDVLACEKIVVSHDAPEGELDAVLADWKLVGKRFDPETIETRKITLLWPGLTKLGGEGAYKGRFRFREKE